MQIARNIKVEYAGVKIMHYRLRATTYKKGVKTMRKVKADDNGMIMGVDEHGMVRNMFPISSEEYYHGKVKLVSLSEIAGNFDAAKGQFVTVMFRKKNGDNRVMNGRKGVTRYLSGGVNRDQNPFHRTLFCTRRKGYRNFDLQDVIVLRMKGNTYIRRNY